MTICGQSYDSERTICMQCSNYLKCDTQLCEKMLLSATTNEEKDYWNARAAENKGG